jgi:putative flippase GtrA
MKKEFVRTVKYVLIAASAGIVQFTATAILELIFGATTKDDPIHWVFYSIALLLSVIWNFTINRRYTFKSAANVKKAMLLVLLFYVFFGPFSAWLDHWLADVNGWHWIPALLVNMFINLALEFPYQRFFVFRNSIDTNDLARAEAAKERPKDEQNDA